MKLQHFPQKIVLKVLFVMLSEKLIFGGNYNE